MAKIVNILRDFTLNLKRDGQLVVLKFKAGVEELEDDVLEHWFTKAHTGTVEKQAPAESDSGKDGYKADASKSKEAPKADAVANSGGTKAGGKAGDKA